MEIDSTAPVEVQAQEPVPEPETIQKRSRKRSITIFVVVSIINAALLVLLWTQLLTPAQNQTGANSNSGSSSIGDINSPLVGKAAPDFTLPVLAGTSKIHLADLKGKPVIVNFWASWCAPCNEEAPFLQKSWPRLQAQGVVFIGIDGPEKTSDAQKFLQKYGISYLNVQDTIDGSTAINYGVTGFPETVFINRDGVVVAKWVFPLTEQGLQLEMAKMAH
ncbi:MAG TPA: TlpA disulfide reductase family protein [Ktedonosporobacter sp.]|jgi:cytochrome c biogenesis protein CcmG/thiol:disulfide interchange protein DsbE|nr:TlpA disulfide reductase family protein [Ktedonosporobacter sp.]